MPASILTAKFPVALDDKVWIVLHSSLCKNCGGEGKKSQHGGTWTCGRCNGSGIARTCDIENYSVQNATVKSLSVYQNDIDGGKYRIVSLSFSYNGDMDDTKFCDTIQNYMDGDHPVTMFCTKAAATKHLKQMIR